MLKTFSYLGLASKVRNDIYLNPSLSTIVVKTICRLATSKVRLLVLEWLPRA